MATLTIRQLDEDLKQKLRVRAAVNGRSMEAEARAVLREGLTGERTESANLAMRNSPTGLESWNSIRERFKEIGYVEPEELKISPREKGRELPTFE